jgi:hypothetical protein
MSDTPVPAATAQSSPRESEFIKGFIPGLVVGLLIGLAVGAFVPPLLTQEKILTPDPNAPKRTGAPRERDERPPGEPAPTETKPTDPAAKPTDPAKKPETPPTPATPPTKP